MRRWLLVGLALIAGLAIFTATTPHQAALADGGASASHNFTAHYNLVPFIFTEYVNVYIVGNGNVPPYGGYVKSTTWTGNVPAGCRSSNPACLSDYVQEYLHNTDGSWYTVPRTISSCAGSPTDSGYCGGNSAVNRYVGASGYKVKAYSSVATYDDFNYTPAWNDYWYTFW